METLACNCFLMDLLRAQYIIQRLSSYLNEHIEWSINPAVCIAPLCWHWKTNCTLITKVFTLVLFRLNWVWAKADHKLWKKEEWNHTCSMFRLCLFVRKSYNLKNDGWYVSTQLSPSLLLWAQPEDGLRDTFKTVEDFIFITNFNFDTNCWSVKFSNTDPGPWKNITNRS